MKRNPNDSIANHVTNWYKENIGRKEGQKALDAKSRGLIEWLREDGEEPNEDGLYTCWAMEITSGAHGQYTSEVFNKEITGTSPSIDKDDLERAIEKMDIIFEELANRLNQYTQLPGEYYLGHHEADGSIGILYREKADE